MNIFKCCTLSIQTQTPSTLLIKTTKIVLRDTRFMMTIQQMFGSYLFRLFQCNCVLTSCEHCVHKRKRTRDLATVIRCVCVHLCITVKITSFEPQLNECFLRCTFARLLSHQILMFSTIFELNSDPELTHHTKTKTNFQSLCRTQSINASLIGISIMYIAVSNVVVLSSLRSNVVSVSC